MDLCVYGFLVVGACALGLILVGFIWGLRDDTPPGP